MRDMVLIVSSESEGSHSYEFAIDCTTSVEYRDEFERAALGDSKTIEDANLSEVLSSLVYHVMLRHASR